MRCTYFTDDKLWKRVDVDESLMYGPVGGFMGLEELDGDYDLAQDQDGLFKVKVRKGRAQGRCLVRGHRDLGSASVESA